jgi:hypothetical protein
MNKPALRAADRLTQTAAALARLLDQMMNDIQSLDSEVGEQVRSAAQEAEAALVLEGSERLKAAVEEAEQNTRVLLAGEMEVRFNQQIAAAVEAARNELITEHNRLTEELEQLKSASTGWETERARLLADCEHANHLLEQSRKERDGAVAEADEAASIALELQVASAVNRVRAELTERMDADLATLKAERNRAQQRLADAASEHELQLNEAVSNVRSELNGEIERLRRELQQARNTDAPAQVLASTEASPDVTQAVRAEVAHVESLIQALSQVIESSETELSVVIRKNVERAELQSYLRGLRFRISGT